MKMEIKSINTFSNSKNNVKKDKSININTVNKG